MESLKLDYTIDDIEERKKLVNQIIEQSSPSQLSPFYLEKMANYLIDKTLIKKQKQILTDNRMLTLNKRETSYEGLSDKLENGENGIYNLTSDLGKNTILTLKDPITTEEIEAIPALKELRESIKKVEEEEKKARGKKRYLLKKQIIEMRKDQYVIRNEYRGNIRHKKSSTAARMISKLDLPDKIHFDESGNPVNDGPISLFNPTHIEALLCNYSGLKESSFGSFDHDLWYLMEDLDDLVERTLKYEYPLYYDLLIYKIDGLTNAEIQALLARDHNIHHSIEYISVLWRNKIPNLLADQAQKDYLIWYYTNVEEGEWKKCSRCGQVKLAHNKFFSKNKSSKDGWYSLCKECRNAGSRKNIKKREAKEKYLKILGGEK